MKSMFQMGFGNSFFDAPRIGAKGGGNAGVAAAFPMAVSTFAPSVDVMPAGWPYSYYYEPYPQGVYQVQAPVAVQPAPTVVTTEGVPAAAYYVGAAALIAGVIALVASR